MNPPPLPQSAKPYSARSWKSWIFSGRWWLVATICVVAFIVFIGRSHRANKDDSPDDFARLCEIILLPMPSQEANNVAPTAAEQGLAVEEIQRDLQRIADNGLVLAEIARERQQVAATAKTVFNDVGNAVATGLTGLVKSELSDKIDPPDSGQKEMWEGAKGFGKQMLNVYDLDQKIDITRLKLAKLAARFSAAESPQTPLAIEFTEEQPGFWEKLKDEVHADDGKQTLRISHGMHQTLHNCVVSVRLVTPAGKSFAHHYYIKSWVPGEHRMVQFDTSAFLGETDEAVSLVQIQVFARELTTPLQEITRSTPSWPYTK